MLNIRKDSIQLLFIHFIDFCVTIMNYAMCAILIDYFISLFFLFDHA